MRMEREDGGPSGAVRAWLSQAEAHELAAALIDYFDEAAVGATDPGWHHHLGTGEHELTIAVDLDVRDGDT
jgi:hypothetical protein